MVGLIAVLVVGGAAMGFTLYKQQLQLVAQQDKQPAATETTTVQSITENPEKTLPSSCPRARVLTDYTMRPDGSIDKTFYSISVDGKKLNGSVTASDTGRIENVQVSSDCKSLAWIVAPLNELDATGNYTKAETVRFTMFDQNTVRNFTLPVPGPASVIPFTSNNIIVAIGALVISESDVPSEDALSSNFYAIEVGTGATAKIGGPFLAVSPDLQKIVKKVGANIVLENKVSGKAILLAKGDSEFAHEYVFSPDSNKLAYIWFGGKRGDIFAILFRPIALDDQTIVSAKIAVQPVDGSSEFVPIRGGYNINHGWDIDRWLSSDLLQYTQSEYAARDYQVDMSARPPTVEKQGLIDWSSI